jgi:glucosamine--fructose-6-phosphate aminotransferase (isomerizing)
VHALEKALDRHPLQGLLAIAHTRWATHGIPSQDNAHPHLDQNKTVAVVHNGIIENYHQLKQTLIKDKGISFSSDTDTEVIAQLIPLYYEGNFLEACLKSLPSLEGSFALAILHKDHPDELIATAEKNPLIVGWDEASKDCYVTSDVNALSSPHVKLYFLAQVPQYLS